MQYRELNGRKLSVMSLGTVQLGMKYGISNKTGQPSVEESHRLLRCAMENGVNAVDTSRDYGTSEDVLGGFFRTVEQPPFVTTKSNVHCEAGTPDDIVEQSILECVRTSLTHLGISKIDCLLLHNGMDMFRFEKPIMAAFRQILDNGYAAAVGMSVYKPEEVEKFLSFDELSAIQVPMSIFDQKLISGGYIERLAASGRAVFVRSVFLQGLCFMDPDDTGYPELTACVGPYLKKLRAYSAAEGISPAQLCMSFIRDLPGVTSLVLGAETPAQVAQNVTMIEGPALSPDTRAKITAEFADFPFDRVMKVLADRYGK